jgi:nucleotide-binding universal stress UspA family protein
MATLVVGYDGTEGAQRALAETVRVAQELGGDVVAVFAYDRVVVGGESGDLDALVSERGHALLREAAARAAEAGVALTGRYIEAGPAQALVAVADDVDARFIVVGSYGERPLKGALVGSTPYKLLHLSERPVLVVRVPG